VVIGSGFSGLAVASELCRQGVDSIVVEGMLQVGAGTRSDVRFRSGLGDRGDIFRLLVHYAQSHHLDIRSGTHAVELSRAPLAAAGGQWMVRTGDGILLADSIVLTRGAQNQLRRLLSGLGIGLGRDLLTALRSLGIYLVGVGDTLAPSTKDILHQAKLVGQAISATTAAA
jgi:glycine/D-amino acid oxidase-like deaminating enzyme